MVKWIWDIIFLHANQSTTGTENIEFFLDLKIIIVFTFFVCLSKFTSIERKIQRICRHEIIKANQNYFNIVPNVLVISYYHG